MSRENVIKFYEEVKNSENLKKEFEGLRNQVESGEEKREESLAKKIVSLAKENGFDFTEKELLSYMEEVKGTLSEEELLSVSGGVSPKALGVGMLGALMLTFAGGAVVSSSAANAGAPVTTRSSRLPNFTKISIPVIDNDLNTAEIRGKVDVGDNEALVKIESKMIKRLNNWQSKIDIAELISSIEDQGLNNGEKIKRVVLVNEGSKVDGGEIEVEPFGLPNDYEVKNISGGVVVSLKD